MSLQDKILPVQSVVALTEILNQRTIWDRRQEFTSNAWNLCGRLYRGIYTEDVVDEFTEKDLEALSELLKLVGISYTDGIGYTVETNKELYEASGVMISLTELYNLLSLVEKIGKNEEEEDDS